MKENRDPIFGITVFRLSVLGRERQMSARSVLPDNSEPPAYFFLRFTPKNIQASTTARISQL